ncbi:uncharacterized protein LOC100569174 [Acyrthosiphon pisum]|uniref:Uncharacterized protein n=1 Tax=Acyrthosiphon pisum TaxID=7029 RepID=A0A8R2A5B6_ACYPI|nr:uncharacterized protein LOC100569174 [Acyrthosiphon pisum]|eukprot:XP_003241797.1 PREDICTED: uncharacterized protein LOC100569174 [Acyrthosiphon pisum]
MGKHTIDINDVHMAIQMAKEREYPTSSPLDNSGQGVPKNINKTSTSGTINAARQNAIDEAVDNIIRTLSDENVDDLPVISDLDIEEVIRSIQDNQEPIADKVMEFNVDALLNDPYTL